MDHVGPYENLMALELPLMLFYLLLLRSKRADLGILILAILAGVLLFLGLGQEVYFGYYSEIMDLLEVYFLADIFFVLPTVYAFQKNKQKNWSVSFINVVAPSLIIFLYATGSFFMSLPSPLVDHNTVLAPFWLISALWAVIPSRPSRQSDQDPTSSSL